KIVESVLWPKREVKQEFMAYRVVDVNGRVHQGYKDKETNEELVLRDPAAGTTIRFAKADVEECREIGTLMPDGLTAAMTGQERSDLFRFLMELGRTEGLADLAHGAATFPLERTPLNPKHWPNWQHYVNRDRLYDFYARQADHFRKQPSIPMLLAEFPGLDGP